MDDQALLHLEELSRIGDQVADIRASEAWKVIETLILEPLDRKAFETFKKVDPRDTEAVIQTQIMSKMVDQIRKEMEVRIQEGKAAQQALLLSTPEEG